MGVEHRSRDRDHTVASGKANSPTLNLAKAAWQINVQLQIYYNNNEMKYQIHTNI